MNLDSKLHLSYYKQIGFVNEEHDVKLVRHVVTNRIFVMKQMRIYDLRVFEYLNAHPSPGIPRIEELIEDGSCLHVVEDYVSGLSLRSILDHSGPLPEVQALDLAIKLCRILSPLHRQDPPIVHRDIKPGNLIITDDGQVVLVDFNSAKESCRSSSHDTVLIGTAGYAAPEQYGFSASTPTTDIYAIGVLLSEMLTGVLPSEKIYTGPLEKIIQKCMEMDPKNRFRDADELLHALLKKAASPARQPKAPKEKEPGHWRDWLPPGFRNKSPAVWIASGFGYLFLLTLCNGLHYTDTAPATPYSLWIYRTAFFFVLLGEVLWLGNYRKIWSQFPLSSSKNPVLKFIGIALWSMVFLFPPMLLGVLLEYILML